MSALALLLLATAQKPEVQISDLPRPGIGRVCVQAVIKLPPLTPREWGALEIIRDTLPEGTETFTRFDLLNYATMAGEPMKVTLAADHVRIGYEVPRGNLRLSSEILRDLLDKAYLREEAITKTLDSTPYRRRSSWEQMLSPWRSDFTEMKRADVMRVYRRVFRPENTTVCVSGDFLKGEGLSEFAQRFDGWAPEDAGRRRIIEGKPGQLVPSRQTATSSLTAEMTAPPQVLMLTAFTLGVGKGGAAFRVVREAERISYRQEAVLAPSEKGWRFGLLFPHSGEFDKSKLVAALKKDIDGWDEATLERARGMVAATMDLNLGALPVYLDPRRPLQMRLEDETYWLAYCQSKKMPAMPYDGLRTGMNGVSLAMVKDLALDWISNAQFAP